MEIFLPDVGWLVGRIAGLRYSSACGRCFVWFVLDPVSVHGPKSNQTKHLPGDGNKRDPERENWPCRVMLPILPTAHVYCCRRHPVPQADEQRSRRGGGEARSSCLRAQSGCMMDET